MNRLEIIGNVVNEKVELRTVNVGGVATKVCSFRVGVNVGNVNKNAMFFEATAWREAAQVLANGLHKGSKVFLAGPLSADTNTVNGVTYHNLKITVRDFEFCDNRGAGTKTENAVTAEEAVEAFSTVVDDNELPFEV